MNLEEYIWYKYYDMFKTKILLIISLILILNNFSYSRRVRSLYLVSLKTFSVDDVYRYWNLRDYNSYPWINEVSHPPNLERINLNLDRLAMILNDVEAMGVITVKDLEFVIACLKHEANYFTYTEGWKYVATAVLSPDLKGGELLNYIIQHLIWFYNYLRDKGKGIIGVDLEKERQVWGEEGRRLVEGGPPVYLFHGTLLGIVHDAVYHRDGEIGAKSTWVCLTANVNSAEGYADPESREREYLQELENPEWPGAPLKSLAGVNQILSKEAKRLPNKFCPVILKFKLELSLDSKCHQMRIQLLPGRVINTPEFAYEGSLSLNYLTYDCKERLVEALDIKEPLPWMDEEWEEIIKGR